MSGITPTADFACLAPRCRQDGGEATVYELPITTTRCPVCGSKRVRRLYNKVAVLRGAQPERDPRLTSSSPLVRSTALLQPGFDEADVRKPPKDMQTFAVNAKDASGLAQGKGRPMTALEVARARRQDPYSVAAILSSQAVRQIPTVVQGREGPS